MLFWFGSDPVLIILAAIIFCQIVALVLDHFLGEVKRYHPLVGFGVIAALLESRFNSRPDSRLSAKLLGFIAWFLAIIPFVVISSVLLWLSAGVSITLFYVLNALLLYFTLGLHSLKQHADWVAVPLEAVPLKNCDLEEAREKVSWLVSRHTDKMNQTQMIKACIESVLENGNDAVFGALFWFAIAGAPGAILYRLVNTLDASWGYRSQRFLYFGFCAARMDDLLNYLPARLASLSYSFCGNRQNAFRSWSRITDWRKTDGRGIGSPNAGIVMASGAGALCLSLGGSAIYDGVKQTKPELGSGKVPEVMDIRRAQKLLNASVVLFMVLLIVLQAGIWMMLAFI